MQIAGAGEPQHSVAQILPLQQDQHDEEDHQPAVASGRNKGPDQDVAQQLGRLRLV